MKCIFITCLMFLASFVYGQKEIKGYVKSNGKGISGVVVSSGTTVVQTDNKGFYKLEANLEDKFVQISTPSGYLAPRNGTIPIFYSSLSADQSVYNFELLKNEKSDVKHNFIAQTDVQVANEGDLSKYKQFLVKDILATQKERKTIDWFGVDLGDLVGDDPKLMPKYEETMREIDMPFYRLIGNHDMAYWGRSHETSEVNFNKNFGPTRYSFNKGNAHYIVINNNFYVGRDYFYLGYIDEDTFKWIEKDLSFIPEGKLVFFMMHIPSRLQVEQKPFAYTSSELAGITINAEPLYAMLKNYNVHILSGHTHLNNNIQHHANLMEHNIAAASGSWWSLPLCTDGTPRGYRVFEVDGDDVKWYYKSEGKEKSYQSRSYIDSTGTLISNVWNYDSKWKVYWWEDGVQMGEMSRFDGFDKTIQDMCLDRSALKYNWINPSSTNHLFRASLKHNNSEIVVKIVDRFNNIYTEYLN